jgi:hypothetical protein
MTDPEETEPHTMKLYSVRSYDVRWLWFARTLSAKEVAESYSLATRLVMINLSKYRRIAAVTGLYGLDAPLRHLLPTMATKPSRLEF